MIQYVKIVIADKLGLKPEEINPEEPFFSFGITSLISEAVRAELLEKYAGLSSTVLFEYPNVYKLASYLCSLEIRQGESIPIGLEQTEEEEKSTISSENKNQQNGYEIAVIGMAGRFPKAQTVTELWENLFEGKDCIEEIPENRWDYSKIYSEEKDKKNKITSKYGGFLEDVDKFDPLFFHISPKEAERMDPQQKLFLLTCYETMEDAGYARTERRRKNVIGVYAGVTWNEISLLTREEEIRRQEHMGAGALYWSIPNRVSYFLNLTGPSIAVDTACSSSLTAIHQACRAILSGDCDMALAGGVNLSLHPNKYLYLSASKFLSPDGKCKSFGEDANGYVVGEGVASVLLKPLAKAERDGDHIYGVIRGTAVNHGGKATGYTVPNPESHKKLIQTAMKRAKVKPHEISYVECHGTGTALGDPIEVRGLSEAFEEETDKKQYCAIGSVKSNIGHLEAAAGVTGLIKILLCMRNHKIPASLHSRKQNPKIPFEQTPFYVIQDNQDWCLEKGKPVIAALSSFGAGGSNAHAIVESYEMPIKNEENRSETIYLSAQSKSQVLEYAKKLSAYLTMLKGKEYEKEYTLSNISGTLLKGRERFPYRIAFNVASVSELIEKLNHFSSGEAIAEEAVDLALEDGGEHSFLTVPLPCYPFLKEKSWILEGNVLCPEFNMQLNWEMGHPFFEINRSTRKRGLFEKNFKNHEFFLQDHVIFEQYVLPGVCHLEIARQGAEFWKEEKVTVLRDIWYFNPIVVGASPQKVVYEFTEEGESVHYEIRKDNSELYSRGEVFFNRKERKSEKGIEFDLLTDGMKHSLTRTQIYQLFGQIGIFQKYSFQVINRYLYGEKAAFAKLELPSKRNEEFQKFYLHPSLLDGAIQTAMVHWILQKNNGKLIVPFYFRQIQIYTSFTETVYVYTVFNAQNSFYDITIYNEDQTVAVEIKEFIVKEADNKENGFSGKNQKIILQEQIEKMLYKPVWIESRQQVKDVQVEQTSSVLIVYRREAEFEKNALMAVCEGTEIYEIELSYKNVRISKNKWLIDIREEEAVIHCIEEIKSVQEVYFLGGIGREDFISDSDEILKMEQEFGVITLYRLIQAIKANNMEETAIYVLAKQSCSVQSQEKIHPYGGSLLGLAGVAAKEYVKPEIRFIDIDDEIDFVMLRKILRQSPKFSCLAMRKNQLYERKILQEKGLEQKKTVFKKQGVYLILGGAGGIGTALSNYLAKQYQAKLIWIGRSNLDEEKTKKIETIHSLGGEVYYIQADASDIRSMKAAVEAGKKKFGSIHGVVHSALDLVDKTLMRMDEKTFRKAIVPKIYGSFCLYKAIEQEPLDFMMFFSSVVSFLFSPGQSNYTAGNTFEDAFAAYLDSRTDYPVKVINWGYWGETGVAASEKYHRQMSIQGIRPVLTDYGMNIIERVLVGKSQQILALDARKDVVEHIGLISKEPQETWDNLKQSDVKRTVQFLGEAFEAESYVKQILSEILMIDESRIEMDGTLEEYGVDSLVILDLNKRFEEDFGKLPVTLLFENVTVGKLCHYFEEKRKVQNSEEQEKNPDFTFELPEKKLDENMEIAIVGISGRFPGAENLEQFWENLRDGEDCVCEIPKEKWDFHKYFSNNKRDKRGKMYSKWGGFIKGVDEFDPMLFKITPNEVWNMDPQQRLFLETVWGTLEDAGYTKESLCRKTGKRNVGVFAASMWNEYQIQTEDYFREGGSLYNSYSYWGIANRVSYHFNFNGPSISVDTACSSSLAAVKLACESLKRGECSSAIAGGVNLSLHPGKYIKLCQNGFLSSDGKCRSFGEGGDGFVPGEGVCAILLKPLENAKQDGDHIYAVLKGMAENHGGKAKGFTVPNPEMQAELIEDALKNSGITPRTISCIEAHGTGTSLGDPIEIRGLTKAFSRYTDACGFCSIGSLKSNIGHLEAAAGIASIAKVITMMKYRKLVPSLHSEKVNPHISFEETPFYLQHSLSEWEKPVIEGTEYPRRAGISSFGAGGSNVHMILEEYEEEEVKEEEKKDTLILLSAAESGCLRENIMNLTAFLKKEPERIKDGTRSTSLKDMAYTLQCGREVMNYKFAVIVQSKEELLNKLEQHLSNKEWEQDYGYAKTKKILKDEEQERFEVQFAAGDYKELKEAWMEGFIIDWEFFYENGKKKCHRVSLPIYAFSREKFRIPMEQ